MESSNRPDKIATLIGFAVKAGKLIYGLDELDSSKKKRYLVVMCNSLSPNSKQKVLAVAKRDHVPVVETTNKLLEDIVHKSNCKVIGLSNKQMSDAILKYKSDKVAFSEDYLLYKVEEF